MVALVRVGENKSILTQSQNRLDSEERSPKSQLAQLVTEAIAENIQQPQLLAMEVANGGITGRFKSGQRVFEYQFKPNTLELSYKPFTKRLDSDSDRTFSSQWRQDSDLYLTEFSTQIRQDNKDRDVAIFLQSLEDTLRAIAPITALNAVSISRDGGITGIYSTLAEKFRFSINANGDVETQSADTREDSIPKKIRLKGTRKAVSRCGITKGSRRCGRICLSSAKKCRITDPKTKKLVLKSKQIAQGLLSKYSLEKLESKIRDFGIKTGKTPTQVASGIAKARTLKGKPTSVQQAIKRESLLNNWAKEYIDWEKSGEKKRWINSGQTNKVGTPLIQAYIRNGEYSIGGKRVNSIQLANIEVDSSMQGQGIFSSIIQAVHRRNHDKAIVIEVANENSVALAKKNGFIQDESRPDNWYKLPSRKDSLIRQDKGNQPPRPGTGKKRTKIPTCTAIGYSCGKTCIGLAKTCYVAGLAGRKFGKTEGQRRGATIGAERLGKIKDLITQIESGGKDARKGIKESTKGLVKVAGSIERKQARFGDRVAAKKNELESGRSGEKSSDDRKRAEIEMEVNQAKQQYIQVGKEIRSSIIPQEKTFLRQSRVKTQDKIKELERSHPDRAEYIKSQEGSKAKPMSFDDFLANKRSSTSKPKLSVSDRGSGFGNAQQPGSTKTKRFEVKDENGKVINSFDRKADAERYSAQVMGTKPPKATSKEKKEARVRVNRQNAINKGLDPYMMDSAIGVKKKKGLVCCGSCNDKKAA